MSEPQITHRPLATLTPWVRNARTHSTKQIRQIAASIRQFGFTAPVLIDEAGTILAGHGRVAAATLLGMTEVPCLQIEHLSEAQKRAYVLADNKLALNANWDEDRLATELGALLATDLYLDIGVTGFSIPEVDDLLATVAPEEPDDPADEALPDAAAAHVRSPGADPGRSQRRLPPGLPGPAVPVPQHRPRPGCSSHRVLRPRRAGCRAHHAPDPPVPTRPARRRGGHWHHQPGDLGPPPHKGARPPGTGTRPGAAQGIRPRMVQRVLRAVSGDYSTTTPGRPEPSAR